MFGYVSSLFGSKSPPRRSGPLLREGGSTAPRQLAGDPYQGQVFTKVFRWRLPDGATREPASVEVVGSFTHWQRVALIRDGKVDAWHVAIHHIPGNRTHHYMLLVDGEPFYDRTCDGLAVPHGPQEERYQVMTDKGARVLMMFAQTR